MARLRVGGSGRAVFARPVSGAGSAARSFVVLAMVVFAALTQSATAAEFKIFGVTPDLVLVLLATWTAIARPARGLLWGFGAGFLLDVLSGAPAGTSMLALTVTAYIASMGGAGLFRSNLVWAAMAVALGTLIYYPITMILLATHGYSLDWADAIGTTLPAAVAVNFLATILLYGPISAVERATRARRAYTLS